MMEENPSQGFVTIPSVNLYLNASTRNQNVDSTVNSPPSTDSPESPMPRNLENSISMNPITYTKKNTQSQQSPLSIPLSPPYRTREMPTVELPFIHLTPSHTAKFTTFTQEKPLISTNFSKCDDFSFNQTLRFQTGKSLMHTILSFVPNEAPPPPSEEFELGKLDMKCEVNNSLIRRDQSHVEELEIRLKRQINSKERRKWDTIRSMKSVKPRTVMQCNSYSSALKDKLEANLRNHEENVRNEIEKNPKEFEWASMNIANIDSLLKLTPDHLTTMELQSKIEEENQLETSFKSESSANDRKPISSIDERQHVQNNYPHLSLHNIEQAKIQQKGTGTDSYSVVSKIKSTMDSSSRCITSKPECIQLKSREKLITSKRNKSVSISHSKTASKHNHIQNLNPTNDILIIDGMEDREKDKLKSQRVFRSETMEHKESLSKLQTTNRLYDRESISPIQASPHVRPHWEYMKYYLYVHGKLQFFLESQVSEQELEEIREEAIKKFRHLKVN